MKSNLNCGCKRYQLVQMDSLCWTSLLLAVHPHFRVCCFVQLAGFGWVHFLLTRITVLVTADSWWAERRLQRCWRFADPTGVCVREIILVGKLALKQPGSRGWLDSDKLAGTLWSRGSPVGLAEWKAWPGWSRHGCYALACSTEKKWKSGESEWGEGMQPEEVCWRQRQAVL